MDYVLRTQARVTSATWASKFTLGHDAVIDDRDDALQRRCRDWGVRGASARRRPRRECAPGQGRRQQPGNCSEFHCGEYP